MGHGSCLPARSKNCFHLSSQLQHTNNRIQRFLLRSLATMIPALPNVRMKTPPTQPATTDLIAIAVSINASPIFPTKSVRTIAQRIGTIKRSCRKNGRLRNRFHINTPYGLERSNIEWLSLNLIIPFRNGVNNANHRR